MSYFWVNRESAICKRIDSFTITIFRDMADDDVANDDKADSEAVGVSGLIVIGNVVEC